MTLDSGSWDKAAAEEFVDACHRAARYGLVRYSSGNMSCRLGDGLAAVTKRGSWLGEITDEQVAICRLETGASINGVAATVESVLHFGILKLRNDVNVVLHFQSPFATAVACGRQIPSDFNVIPEIPCYIGAVGVVDYLLPGSPELAEAVIAAAWDHDLLILRNHGQVVVGRDYNDVIQKAGFFELACEIITRQSDPAYITEPRRTGSRGV